MVKARRIIDPKQKIEWGKQYHESDMGRDEFASSVGIVGSQLDIYTAAYRLLNGLEEYRGTATHKRGQLVIDIINGKRKPYGKTKVENRGRPATDAATDKQREAWRKDAAKRRAKAKAAREGKDAEYYAQKREAASAARNAPNGNGGGQHLAVMELPRQAIERYEVRIKELEDQNDWLQHQCDILNKLLMTVGGTL